MKQSITITGLIVILLGFVLDQAKIEFTPDQVDNFVYIGVQIIGLIMTYIGRFRQGDINIFGWKNK